MSVTSQRRRLLPIALLGVALAAAPSQGATTTMPDLARYLRVEPAVLTVPAPAPAPDEGPAENSTGAESAMEPLRKLLGPMAARDREDAAAVERLVEGLLRLGYGVPRRFHGSIGASLTPLRSRVTDLARAIRASRDGTALRKTHLALESILASAQEIHYLHANLAQALFGAGSALSETEASLRDATAFGGIPGRAALLATQVARAARANLTATLDAMEQDRGNLKQSFGALQEALAVLDAGLERIWNKAPDRVVLRDVPGALRSLYDAVRRADGALGETQRRAPALEELVRVNFRSASATVTALASTAPRGLEDPEERRRLAEICDAGTGRLRATLTGLDAEHGRLLAWSRTREPGGRRGVEVTFPPLELLTERAALRVEPETVVWNPETDFLAELFDGLSEASEPETGSFASPSSPSPSSVAPVRPVAPPRGPVVDTDRDLELLDELEGILRPSQAPLADPTTALFLSARRSREAAARDGGPAGASADTAMD